MDIRRVFSDNLKKYRNQVKLSQEAFAENAGLHRTYISGVECGRRSISLDNINKIANALNIPVYRLFLDENEITTKPVNDGGQNND